MDKSRGGVFFCVIAVLCADAMAAEVPIPTDTVADRVREEFRPLGIRAGGFKVYPSVKLQLTDDDNIFADATNEITDTVTTVEPKIDIRSDWSRHSLEIGASANIGRYADNPSEDYDDVVAHAVGRLTTARNNEWQLAARLESLHEDRFSPDDRDGLSPTEYDRSSYTFKHKRRPGRLTLDFDLNLIRLDFDDVQGLEGNINQDDRDRDVGGVSIKAGYGVSPSTTVFVVGEYESTDYDSDVDDNGFARDSESQELAIGADLDLAARTSIEAYFGLTWRNFEDPRLIDIQAPHFGGKFIHRVSGLTTLSASASSTVRETTFDSSSGYVETRFSVGVDHELLRNLVLKLHLVHQDLDYEGIDRQDNVVSAVIGARYLINRNFEVLLDFKVRDRDVEQSIPVDDGYRANLAAIQIIGNLR